MRILAITNLFPTPRHPNRAPFNRQQFAALAAEHELRVIAPVPWTAAAPDALRSRSASPLRSSTRLTDRIISEHPLYVFPPRLCRSSYGHCYRASIRPTFDRTVAHWRPDVILACWTYPDAWAAVQLARAAELPVAVKIHGSDLLLARGPRLRGSIEAMTRADAVIAVSRHLADHALRLGIAPGKIHIVRNGVDADLFRPGDRDESRRILGLPPEEKLLLFVGNLVPVKGVDVLIRALAHLARQGQRPRCLIIGAGPLREKLRAQAARSGLDAQIEFLGPRPLAQLPHYYRAANLLVLPSRSEGIPNVLLEAAACATPSVATRVGGIPEIAAPDSLATPGDAQDLAGRIAAQLRSPQGSAPTGTPSWQDSARALARILHNILPGSAATRAARAA